LIFLGLMLLGLMLLDLMLIGVILVTLSNSRDNMAIVPCNMHY
jgi:hypothetical protein